MSLHQNDILWTKSKKTDHMSDEKQHKVRPDKEGRVRNRKNRKEDIEKELNLSETLKEVKEFLKSEIGKEELKKSDAKNILYLQEDQIISSGKSNLREVLAEDDFPDVAVVKYDSYSTGSNDYYVSSSIGKISGDISQLSCSIQNIRKSKDNILKLLVSLIVKKTFMSINHF